MSQSFFWWLDQLTYALSGLWKWLTSPLISSNVDVIEYASTPLAILSITTILAVLIARVIHVFNPLT